MQNSTDKANRDVLLTVENIFNLFRGERGHIFFWKIKQN